MDLLKLAGSLTTEGAPSDQASGVQLIASLQERMVLRRKSEQTFTLRSDASYSVPLAGLLGVNALAIACSQRVVAKLTSLEGSAQAFPVDGFMLLFTRSEQITSLDLVRTPGVEIEVTVFLGESA